MPGFEWVKKQEGGTPTKQPGRVPKRDLWRAIREKCLDCCAGQTKEVRLCASDICPINPYRMGRKIKPSDLKEDAPDEPEAPVEDDEDEDDE